MLRPLICGNGSFHGDELELCSGHKCKKSSSKNNNPYAMRGLDKFSSLVADLNEKRRRIYAQTGDSDDLYVWFNFSGSDTCKPVILKLKEKQQKMEKKNKPETLAAAKVVEQQTEMISDMKKPERFLSVSASHCSHYTDGLRQRALPRLLAAVILILILLLMFGRSATVMWITVGWYLVPMTKLSLKKRPIPKNAPLQNVRCNSSVQGLEFRVQERTRTSR